MFEYKSVKLGNLSLRQVSEQVSESEFNSKELRNIVDTLFFALKKEGGVGIAAPQIGVNKLIIVFGMEKHPVYTQYYLRQFAKEKFAKFYFRVRRSI